MANLPQEVIESVKQQANIVEVIDQFVALKKQGKNYFGQCPFHDERTPSFSVSEEKQIFKCFSCGKAGNVFSFFMEKDALTFPESVKYVAELIGSPEVITIDTNEPVARKKYDVLYRLHEIAAEAYHHILLHTKEGERAQAYLKERGFTLDTIKAFQIGVSLEQYEFMVNHVQKSEAVDSSDMDNSGLFVKRQDHFIDRFRNRIMFPLRDEKGNVVGFSGRTYLPQTTTDDGFQEPKYLNSPETPLFNKSEFLFNLDLARPFIRKENEVMLCEGFMDVIAVWQAGIKTAVASMGTSLTNLQIRKIKRLSDTVLIAYDGDNAGQTASVRAIDLLRQEQMKDILVLPMENQMDPDEMIQHYGKDYFISYVQHQRVKSVAFLMDVMKNTYDVTTQSGQLDYIDAVLKQLLFVPNLVERSIYFQRISDEFNVSQKALEEQFNRFNNQRIKQLPRQSQSVSPSTSVRVKTKEPNSRLMSAQRQLLQRILTIPGVFETVSTLENQHLFDDEILSQLFILYMGFRYQHDDFVDASDFIDVLNDSRLRSTVVDIIDMQLDEDFHDDELDDIIRSIENERNKIMYNQLKDDLQRAMLQKDSQTSTQILMQMNALLKKLN